MKKLMLIFPILLTSCKKEMVTTITAPQDSVLATDQATVNQPIDSQTIMDTLKVSAGEDELREGITREVDGDKMIRNTDASQIPFAITEEFTNDNQQFIIKIKNFKGQKISGNIVPENPQMNIRFNQIKLPNGDYDGPFGRDISYVVKENGDVWLLVGKSNMASGDAKGKFTVDVK